MSAIQIAALGTLVAFVIVYILFARKLFGPGLPVVLGASAVGLALLATTYLGYFSGFAYDLAINAGTAIMLLAPFYALERALSASVRHLRQRAQQTNAKVKSLEERVTDLRGLTKSLQHSLEHQDESDTVQLRGFSTAPDFETLYALLVRAYSINAIFASVGLRVVIPNTHCRLRTLRTASSEDGVLLIEFAVDKPGEGSGRLSWLEGQSTKDFLLELVTNMQRLGVYPGDAKYDPGTIMADLLASLQFAMAARKRAPGVNVYLYPVIELLNEDWCLTSFGLQPRKLPHRGVSYEQAVNRRTISEDEHSAITEIKEQGWRAQSGEETERFRTAFSSFLQAAEVYMDTERW